MTYTLNHSQKQSIFFLLFLIPFLQGCGVDLYVPSMPRLADYFNTKPHFIQFSIGSYLIGYALGQITLGSLSDIYGRKKIIVGGLALFSLASFLCIWSPNVYFLIFYRFIQGAAIGGPTAASRAIAKDCFSGVEFHKINSFIATSWALGPIVGPLIGGYLQEYFSWQASFYFFGFYSAFIVIYSLFFLPETHSLNVSFNKASFFKTILEVSTHRYFVTYSLCGASVYGILIIFNEVGPFLIQVHLHQSVLEFSHTALILGFFNFLGCLSNQVFLLFFKPLSIAKTAVKLCFIAASGMFLLGIFFHQNLDILIFPAIFVFYTCGLAFSNFLSLSVEIFPNSAGISAAIFGTIVGVSLFVLSYIATLLKTNTQIDMAFSYMILSLLCMAILGIPSLLKEKAL